MSVESELIQRAKDRKAVFGVVGLGYVGLPLAVEIASAGFRVIGFDLSQRVVDGVCTGKSHIKDVPSDRLEPLVKKGLIGATTDMSRLKEPDVISICVPTPLSKTKDPDISFVLSVADAIRKTVRRGQAVILESTTYPGTTRDLLLPRMETDGLKVGEDVFLAFSPERVDPGNPTYNTRNTPKVIGGVTPACQRVAMAFNSPVFERLVPVSSPEAAELVKLLENTFRSVNIALANEAAVVCDLLGIDVWEVIEAAGTKPFGFMKFTPGPGLGGHCIPIDPLYLAWKMRSLNYKTRLIDVASEVNSEMPRFWVERIGRRLNEDAKAVKGSKILVVGVSYKKDIDDMRESPALDIMHLLEERGAEVNYHDPYVPEVRHDGTSHKSVALTEQAIRSADCVVIATDHSKLDYNLIQSAAQRIVDTRNALKKVRTG